MQVMSGHRGKTNGFKRTSVLLERRIKDASQNRGFAQSRVLTHWSEIAGTDIAKIAQPTNVSYSPKHGRHFDASDAQWTWA
jgi:Protein of unknown function (DUF721).